jgi:hypothetical protein
VYRFAFADLGSLHRLVGLMAIALVACGEGESISGKDARPPSSPSDAATRPSDAAKPVKDASASQDGSKTSSVRDPIDAGSDESAAPTPPRPIHADAPSFCRRPGEDAIRDAFCYAPPDIRNLRDLQDAIGLNLLGDEETGRSDIVLDGFSAGQPLVLLGHSTALPGRLISPINPRAIIVGRQSLMAFQRGVQSIELASRARDREDFNFYLVTFAQACNSSPDGCLPGDLYTPQVERDWMSVTIQDDEDLKNTPSDCRQCHRRARDTSVLLMRELDSPWTHFFEPLIDGSPASELPGVRGEDLVRDYLRAKGDEPYGGLPPSMIRETVGLTLENAVSPAQPLLFDAPRVEDDRFPFGPDGWPSEPGRSAWWDSAFAAFQRGEQLPLPHYEARPTDPRKQQVLTEAYQRYLAGTLPASELPDLADIFPDDAQRRAEIGLETTPDATPAQVLVQACGSCHNDVLDQDISRARFSIDLARLDAAEIAIAIARIELPTATEGVMPPHDARQLPASAKAALLQYLREGKRTAEDDALLKSAAQLGMAGGARPPRVRPDSYPYPDASAP